MQTTFDISLPKGKIIKLVDWVKAKTKQTELLRSRAYELAVPGIYERMCGNKGRASEMLLSVVLCIEDAIELDEEISEHSSKLIELCKEVEVAEHDRRRARTVLTEEKYNLDRVQFHISTALRHSIELQRKYEDASQLTLHVRNEEERYGQLCLTDREVAEDLRSRAEKGESDAARLSEDLDVMMGTWVNDC